MGASAAPGIAIFIEYLRDPSSRSCVAQTSEMDRLIDGRCGPIPGAFDVDDVLVAIGEPAVPALCRELDDGDVVRRSRVVRILGRIEAPAKQAVPRLVKLLEDHDLRVVAADALARIVPEARDDTNVLFAALKGGDGASRAEAAMVLGRIGGAQKALAGRIVRFSISATRDSDSRVRAAAVLSIGKIATLDDELFRLMCRALTDPVPHVKVACSRALAGCGRRRESLVLRTGLLNDPDSRVRVEAIESMNRDDMDSGPVIAGLVELLGDTDAAARTAAADKIGKCLKWLRPSVLSGLGFSTDSLYERLRRHLRDTEPKVRAVAACMLPQFEGRKTDSIAALLGCLKDEAALVRCAAVKAIVNLGPAAHVTAPALLDRLSDTGQEAPDRDSVSILAAGALETMGGEVRAELMRRLVGMLGSVSEVERQNGFLALRELGDESVGPLTKVLCDPNASRSIKSEILDVFTAPDGSPQQVRVYSGRLICELRGCLPSLNVMMQDDDPVVRRRVFRLIAAIDPGPDVVVNSFMAAARIQDPAEMEELADFLKACDIRRSPRASPTPTRTHARRW